MNWDNVKLIVSRELRDQARDRRTLFSVIGLPILLYPLMGMLVMQLMQFGQPQDASLQIIGLAEIPKEPSLVIQTNQVDEVSGESLIGYEFSPTLIELTGVENRFKIDVTEGSIPVEVAQETAKKKLTAESLDAILYFPPGFKARIEEFQKHSSATGKPESLAAEFPSPQVFVNSAKKKSNAAQSRLRQLLHAWRESIIEKNLKAHDVPTEITNPFVVQPVDLSEAWERSGSIWSGIFPFIVVIWALTGAFYPAIDLCAGEKERGTLETLLSSPALRSEIVAGKMLAIMVFSIATSLLNLISLGITTTFVLGQFAGSGMGGKLDFGPPPIWSLGWLVLALIPMAALFSALALAIAAMARSSKEGQYYLLPLLLVNLPLVVVPVLPNVELEFSTSLIPVAGMLLLLKSLIEGQYTTAITYVIPVLGTTAFCIWISVRWAIDQFNNESVLFSESERFNLWLWLKKVYRDRKPTPSMGAAFLIGIMLLALPHMLGGWVPLPKSAGGFAVYMLTTQIGFILLPVILGAAFLARSYVKTFSLRLPNPTMILMAILMAICIHPFSIMLGKLIESAIPLPEEKLAGLEHFLGYANDLPFWAVLGLFALLPAICEEFAFRGFILSGLRHLGHKWGAIAISAVFFGLLHGILQQTVSASIVGMLIGFIAVQTRSIWPGIFYHFVHNRLSLGYASITDTTVNEYNPVRVFVDSPNTEPVINPLWMIVHTATNQPGEAVYNPIFVGMCALAVLMLVRWFQQLPAELSEEERRQSALSHQETHPLPQKSKRSTAV